MAAIGSLCVLQADGYSGKTDVVCITTIHTENTNFGNFWANACWSDYDKNKFDYIAHLFKIALQLYAKWAYIMYVKSNM